MIGLVLELPTLICMLFLVVNFLWLAIRGLNEYQRHIAKERIARTVAFPVHLQYVKDLLKGDKIIE